jgi:hypothetical protein
MRLELWIRRRVVTEFHSVARAMPLRNEMSRERASRERSRGSCVKSDRVCPLDTAQDVSDAALFKNSSKKSVRTQ